MPRNSANASLYSVTGFAFIHCGLIFALLTYNAWQDFSQLDQQFVMQAKKSSSLLPSAAALMLLHASKLTILMSLQSFLCSQSMDGFVAFVNSFTSFT